MIKLFDATTVFPTTSKYPDGLPGRSKVDTSTDAAIAIAPKLNKIQHRVYNFVAARGSRGATASEISATLDIWRDSVGPRLTELRDAGLIADSKSRRPSPRGKGEIAWIEQDADAQTEIF